MKRQFFSTKSGIILAGAIIGVIAAVLQYMGNPPNMGFCIACFERDIAGGLGLHRAEAVQYIRPEIIGIMIGALLVSMVTGEFRPRGGSSATIRFFLGVFAMIGALVFLGCPWRAFIRLAGGDLNAVTGIAGLVTGVAAGAFFIRKGYSLGRSYPQQKPSGLIMPVFMLFLLMLFLFNFPRLFQSVTGPGAMKAPVVISLLSAMFVGAVAQRSRFCTMGSVRDVILVRDFHLLTGILAFTAAVFVMNLLLGQFNPGFTGQPIAHNSHVWNFAGMALSGLAFALSGGCPGRQLILTGEGDSDAGVFVLGMIAGAAFSHNFGMASSPSGIGDFGMWGVIAGFIFCFSLAFVMIQKRGKTASKAANHT
jgi:uncharacterized protein